MPNLFASVSRLIFGTMEYFYAVAKGRNPGVYKTWDECKAEVNKFPRPVYKKFPSKAEAEDFVNSRGRPLLKPKSTREASALNKWPNKLENNLRYDQMEKRLKDWAKNTPSLTQLDIQTEASRIANELGIENFNQSGGWIKYHLECNPDIYKSLRIQSSGDKESDQRLNLERKLSSLESRISGLSTSGGSLPTRIRILEHTLHSMHQELHEIKRHLSTDTQGCFAPTNVRKRKKPNDTESAQDSDEDSRSSENSGTEKKFDIDTEGYVNVYTDGACSGNGTAKAVAGIGVWFGDEHPLNVSQPVADGCRATNNLAEIQAVTVAAKQAAKAGVKKLKINTDSQFLISCITQWMPKWKRNGWRKNNGQNVINKEELIEMETALQPLKIAWNHVNGHAGIRGNEMADALARAGAASQSTK
ncbi:ribonuclease H [Diprion similis]|uniref:ribonuclease H n=1 Tax=Diprion similis TaxID=362088 RepID=UPI001EF91E9D|nr:ribonuclease H [Diprion similis]